MSRAPNPRVLFRAAAVVLAAAAMLACGRNDLVAQSQVPPLRTVVGFDQNLGAQLPLEAEFTDASGERTALRQVIRNRPAVLLFGYFSCPQLCGVTSDGALDALVQIQPTIGADFDLVYISIDPSDTAPAAAKQQAERARRYGRGLGEAGWHYLVGDKGAIAAVCDAAGFRFHPVSGTGEFAHPSGFVVVEPDGTLSHYFLGLDFRAAEVAAALRAAREGRTGDRVFDLLLVCLSGGLRPGLARWAFIAVQVAAGLTVFALGSWVVSMLRAERRAAVANRNAGRMPS